ncbi:MAG: hypothetical protein ACI8TV_000549 [Porticoccaceae bacterium]|jgi:hypothetical protein
MGDRIVMLEYELRKTTCLSLAAVGRSKKEVYELA